MGLINGNEKGGEKGKEKVTYGKNAIVGSAVVIVDCGVRVDVQDEGVIVTECCCFVNILKDEKKRKIPPPLAFLKEREEKKGKKIEKINKTHKQ